MSLKVVIATALSASAVVIMCVPTEVVLSCCINARVNSLGVTASVDHIKNKVFIHAAQLLALIHSSQPSRTAVRSKCSGW